MAISVELTKSGRLLIKCPFNENEHISGMAAKRWDKREGAWVAPLVRANAHHVLNLEVKERGPRVQITDAARDALEDKLDGIKISEDAFPEWYEFKRGVPLPMPHQIVACHQAWPRHAYALMMEMGCVAGDTKIRVSYGGKSREDTIEELYRRSLTTASALGARSLKGELFGIQPIEKVWKTGQKECVTLTLDDGKSITCTHEHKFMAPGGAWIEAQNLAVGQELLVNGSRECRREPPKEFTTFQGYAPGFIDKDGYRRVRIPEHPRANRAAAVYEHIVVMERHIGRWISDGEHVHHTDGNKSNNCIENLRLYEKKERLKLHGPESRRNLDGTRTHEGGFQVVVPKVAKVASVRPAGVRDTYDITMAAPHHNYVANGIVVHNTSKTRIVIDLATARYHAGQINRILVICPVSIMSVWKEEVGKWSPYPHHEFVEVGRQPKQQQAMKWMVVGVESLSSSPRTRLAAATFVKDGRTLVVCDESSRIKNGDAIRTKAAIEIAHTGKYRMVLNGTPISKSPLDLWAQYEFLDPRIIDLPWSPFRYTYGIFGGFENKQLVGFQRIDELASLLRPWTFQVLKKDVLKDLPEKTYQVRTVKPSAQQADLMKQIKSMALELHTPDGRLKTQNVLERVLRLQQITSGLLVLEKMDEAGEVVLERTETRIASPKLTEMMAMLEEFDGKAIIWSRFVSDIHEIAAALTKEYGPGSAVEFYGDMTPDERQEARIRFQEDPKCRFFVSNPATGGMGLTLIAATLVIYYACSYAYGDRLQSEDRAHRKGQTLPVTIVDLLVENSVDGLVYRSMQDKKTIAEYVQDNLADIQGVLV